MSSTLSFADQRAIVTGAGRGIGLALTEALLCAGATVTAGVRRPDQAAALHALGDAHPNRLAVLPLDVAQDASVAAFADGAGQGPLDLLINNAGVNLDGGADVFTVRSKTLLDTFDCNAAGPLRLVQALHARLLQSRRAKVANISSIMGSIGENAQGGVVAYRASKAALNMVTKCLALADDKVIYLAMHPGWVQTEMGGTDAPVAPETSARGLLTQIAAATPAQSGTFVRFDGKSASW